VTAAVPGARPLLEVQDLHKHYPVRGGVWGRTVGTVRAVAAVSFEGAPGQTLGRVAESGSGQVACHFPLPAGAAVGAA